MVAEFHRSHGKHCITSCTGVGVGQLLTSFLVGFLMDSDTAPSLNLGPIVLMYVMLSISALTTIVFFFMWWLASKSGAKTESLPDEEKPSSEPHRTTKETLPMRNMAFEEE